MKPAEYFLDEILKQLQKDRAVPVSQRNHLNPDIVLREIIETDRHEDYQEMINMLNADGMIRRVREHDPIAELEKSRDILITIKGSLFIESGGYTKQKETKINDERIKSNRERHLVRGTWAVAFGAVALVCWEMIKFYYYEGHSLCH